MKTVFYTLMALCAFAGNSILCRLALGENAIDAASFTNIRLVSGIVTLLLIYTFAKRTTENVNQANSNANQHSKVMPRKSATGSWWAAAMLFIYAVTFSYAYITLDTGTGALILFASVQLTLIIVSVLAGKRLLLVEWLGLTLAFSGFIYLVLPTLSTPSLLGFVLMSFSGIAWAFYTLAGKQSTNPLADTSFNFFRTLPFVSLLLIFTIYQSTVTPTGIGYAVLSGAIASGVGYAIWYRALAYLSAIQAGVLQLLVPVLAAIGGVVFANEVLSERLIIASLMILGGILLVISATKLLSMTSPACKD